MRVLTGTRARRRLVTALGCGVFAPGQRSVVRLRGHGARLLEGGFRTTLRLAGTPGGFAGLRWRTLGHRTG
ncbi:hypothetical protein ACTWPT_52710 [Nonomuraea sp. 3N208]|uniref:hypothetical protein n=1 Tax=Nonomuraea sp. 3N208 TaxID=3457421 RepID=UPI003FD10AF7